MRRLERYKEIVWFSGIIVGVLLWAITTFAMKKEVEDVQKYVDIRHDEVMRQQIEMKSTLEQMDRRIYEIWKRFK